MSADLNFLKVTKEGKKNKFHGQQLELHLRKKMQPQKGICETKLQHNQVRQVSAFKADNS